MFKQKFVTFGLYLMVLTLGAGGIVTAFNGAGSLDLSLQPEANPQEKAPAADSNVPDAETVQQALDYDWHEYGPFRTRRTAEGKEVIVDRLHVYFKTEDDIFRGRITALMGVMDKTSMDDEPLNVRFVQNNTVVAATTLKPDGAFEIAGLAPGPYDIHVLSKNSLYVASFVLSSREDLKAAGFTQEQIDRLYARERNRTYQLEAAGCIPDDYGLVVELLNETYDFSKQVEPPPKFPKWTRLHIPKVTDFDDAEGGTSYLRHTVRLAEDGILYGHLRKPVDLPTEQVGIKQIGDIEVFFLQNNQIVARTFADEEGHFTIADLTPGNYSVVARSPYAEGVIGVRVIEFENAAAGLINMSREKAAPGGSDTDVKEADEPAGPGDSQSASPAEHYTTPVSLLVQPDGVPNLSLDMSLATPFELPVPPPQEQEEFVPVAGAGGGGGGGGAGFFFPPFGWGGGGNNAVSPIIPAPGPPGP